MSRKKQTFNVIATPWRRGWELHIDGVGVTQSNGLTDAAAMAREYIALDLDIPERVIDVELTIKLAPDIDGLVGGAREAVKGAADAQLEAAERSRTAVRKLVDLGLSGRDIGIVMGVSPQRVSQLAKSAGASRTVRKPRSTISAGR